MTIKLKPLDQQVIVVTGASSGIGLVTARTAAAKGATVLMLARSGGDLVEAVREIEAAGGKAAFYEADVGDPDAVEAAAAFAQARFGRIDTWVSNAGSTVYGKVLETPLDDQQQLFRTNYFGTVHSAVSAVPRLRQHGGALIVVGSIGSDIPAPPLGVYCATKHAAKAYVEVLRAELAEEEAPISVTLVKPSGIDTPIAQHAENVHDTSAEAQLPPPVYDPQLVADAILDAAVNPRRDVTVGGIGRGQVLFAQHFPKLWEKMAGKAGEISYDPETPQPQPSNLYAPTDAGRERSGEHPHARKHSLYTTAERHPKTTAAGLAAVVGLTVGGLVLTRKS